LSDFVQKKETIVLKPVCYKARIQPLKSISG